MIQVQREHLGPTLSVRRGGTDAEEQPAARVDTGCNDCLRQLGAANHKQEQLIRLSSVCGEHALPEAGGQDLERRQGGGHFDLKPNSEG
jgi:hypothetical protein